MDIFLVLVLLLCVFGIGFRSGARWQREHPGELPGKKTPAPERVLAPPVLSGAAWTTEPPKAPETTGVLRFVYEDAEGNQSIRTLNHWEVDGPYIHGYQSNLRDLRTFRRDRVLEWLGDSERLLQGR